jgi:hypothetical protein
MRIPIQPRELFKILVANTWKIATALCGAVDKITPQIQAFLERIPVLKRCDAAIKTPSQLQDVHDVS